MSADGTSLSKTKDHDEERDEYGQKKKVADEPAETLSITQERSARELVKEKDIAKNDKAVDPYAAIQALYKWVCGIVIDKACRFYQHEARGLH